MLVNGFRSAYHRIGLIEKISFALEIIAIGLRDHENGKWANQKTLSVDKRPKMMIFLEICFPDGSRAYEQVKHIRYHLYRP